MEGDDLLLALAVETGDAGEDVQGPEAMADHATGRGAKSHPPHSAAAAFQASRAQPGYIPLGQDAPTLGSMAQQRPESTGVAARAGPTPYVDSGQGPLVQRLVGLKVSCTPRFP